jgi:hypothetical protein
MTQIGAVLIENSSNWSRFKQKQFNFDLFLLKRLELKPF